MVKERVNHSELAFGSPIESYNSGLFGPPLRFFDAIGIFSSDFLIDQSCNVQALFSIISVFQICPFGLAEAFIRA